MKVSPRAETYSGSLNIEMNIKPEKNIWYITKKKGKEFDENINLLNHAQERQKESIIEYKQKNSRKVDSTRVKEEVAVS